MALEIEALGLLIILWKCDSWTESIQVDLRKEGKRKMCHVQKRKFCKNEVVE